MFILEIILGITLLSIGANWLTDGAAAIAKRLKVSEFLIGATIVAVGTSMPELVVSLQSAIAHQSDVAIGNVVGSNIFNIYGILGLTALICPLALTQTNIKRDIPICLATTILVIILALDKHLFGAPHNLLSRVDGIILLALYGLFLWYMISMGRKEGQDNPNPQSTPTAESRENRLSEKIWLAAVMVVVGLCGLVFGSDIFLSGATKLAELLGWSEAVIGIVVVATGTSMPELFASIVPAIKGKSEIALGNILGSNIANILLILGLGSTVTPLQLGGITPVDLLVMLSAVVAVLLSAFCFKRKAIDRPEGVLMLVIYATYTIYLLGA